MTHRARSSLAAALALALAAYATVFSRQTHDLFDLPTFLDLTEWPATLLFLASAHGAWIEAPRRAALLAVAALLAFFAAHGRFLFDVPLGFVAITLACLAILAILPPVWERR